MRQATLDALEKAEDIDNAEPGIYSMEMTWAAKALLDLAEDNARLRHKSSAHKFNIRSMQAAIERYKLENEHLRLRMQLDAARKATNE